MSKLKKPSWLAEFKDFIAKGNAMSLAVGVIIGGAFSTITSSLTNDIIMPVVSMFLGGLDFSAWKLNLPQFFGQAEEPITLNYGTFISTVINFLILAFVVFWMVKLFNRAQRKKAEEPTPPAPPEPSAEEVLLTEIRDLMKEQANGR